MIKSLPKSLMKLRRSRASDDAESCGNAALGSVFLRSGPNFRILKRRESLPTAVLITTCMAHRQGLIDAIEEEDVRKAAAFLASAPPNSVSHRELRAACWQGNVAVFNLLLEHGGTVHTHELDAATQRSLLHDAACNGNTALCKRLLELGIDPSLVSTKDGCTAGELAAMNKWDATAAVFNNTARAPRPTPDPASASATIPVPAAASLEDLLARLDLSKFASKFAAEDVDLDLAAKLTQEELAKLGLTLGARKKLYDALHPSAGPAAAPSPAPPPVPAQKDAAKAPPAPPGTLSAATTPAAIVAQTPPKCDAQHALTLTLRLGRWSCTRCSVVWPARETAWHCDDCDYDLCTKCSPLPTGGGPITPMEPPNLRAPGYHTKRCGAGECIGYMNIASKRGTCSVRSDKQPGGDISHMN